MNQAAQTQEVCLVDDDASVPRSMRYLLASEGMKVRPFNKGESFLSHVAKHRVPVVVLDIWMENVTGLKVSTFVILGILNWRYMCFLLFFGTSAIVFPILNGYYHHYGGNPDEPIA